MLRKPDSKAPLPAFGRDDDESASTGEYKPLAHPLPSFASSDELPRFPSLVDPRELGGEPLPRFPSRSEGERPRAEPRRREPVKLADLDVAATLEKKPMTARAANRILAQLDRAPQRPDETGEIALEDVLEEVYVEPAPPSRRAEPRKSEPAPAPRSEPPPSVRHGAPPSVPVAASAGPASRRAVAELPGSSTVPMPPVSTARPSGAALPLPGSSMVPSYPPASAAPSYPAGAPPAYATHSAAAYAHTVPAGYVLVPEASLTGRDHALSAASDAALVRPLPLAVGASSLDEPKRETTVLTKVLAGGLLLGLSALAGGAASMFLLPEKPTEVPASAVPSTEVPSTPAPIPSAPTPSASAAAPTPSVLAPLGTGWPLAPATVPPGAASMAPPPPSGAPEGAPAPVAPVAPSASAAAVAPAPSSAPLPSHMGRIVFGPARAGHRVWIDGQMMGESDAPKVVKCGKRHVRIGSSAGGQAVDVPCGGEVTLK